MADCCLLCVLGDDSVPAKSVLYDCKTSSSLALIPEEESVENSQAS